MARLIDADALIEFIKEELKQDRPYDFKIRNIQRFIQDAPTAYDVEKVVAELEEKQHQANKDMQISELYEDVQAYGGKYLAFGEAIEIVKAGGKNEIDRRTDCYK